MAPYNFSQTLREILEISPSFSKEVSNNPPMEKREILLQELSDKIRNFLSSQNLDTQLLRVKHGGRQSNYSPVAWVRIFDPEHAPTAQSGYYVVLLFAADGSSVYLSLNQGTSEFRSNAMRPIMKDDILLNRAATARAALNNWSSQVIASGSTLIDLRGESAPVGAESKRRIKNYELANIYTYQYKLTDLPSDSDFTTDIEELLVLLQVLENADLSIPTKFVVNKPGQDETSARKRLGARQGRQINEKIRRLIELTAEDRAVDHYEENGWKVTRVGAQKLGYDLRCIRESAELHVEVKGTTSKGLEVVLTPNEVNHCRQYLHMALVVVSQIEIREDEQLGSKGAMKIIEPWIIDDSYLTPSQYSYRIPKDAVLKN